MTTSTTPLILGFDSSGPHCAAALQAIGATPDVPIAHISETMARGQAERLMGLLEDTLSAASADWHDLTALAVGIGPGNFTGIRISVAAARGLGLGLGIPVLGISTFAAFAPSVGRVRVQVRAPRDTVYAQDFVHGTATHPPAHLPKEDAAQTDLPVIEVAQTGTDIGTHIAPNIASTASRLWLDGKRPAPKPLYVKAPDAAPARDSGPVILP